LSSTPPRTRPLASDDGASFISAAAACTSGTITGTFNGGAVPAAGTAVPLSGTLAATANACVADGSTYTGASSVTYSVTNPEPAIGSANVTVNNMRVTSRIGQTVDRDVTSNGSGSIVFSGSVSGADTTEMVTLTPGAGATVKSELSGLTATFSTGSVALTTVTRAGATLPVRLRVAYNNLAFTVAGTNYLGNGFYEIGFGGLGVPASGSGEVLLTSNGTLIGRIFANSEGVFIDVNGRVQPFGARADALSRR
jgi:hypothetical protein